MAKVNYERLNNTTYTTLHECRVGDVIEWEETIYIVTDEYTTAGDDNFRTIMNILSYYFGSTEKVIDTTTVKVLEDAEITIKY